MTVDELLDASTPTLEQIDFSKIDGRGQLLFLVEHEGAPCFRVWSIDAAAAHVKNLPGCSEIVLLPHSPGLVARIAILVQHECGGATFCIRDLVNENDGRRPQLRVVH